MTPEQYAALQQKAERPTKPRGASLSDQTPRTLIYGYTLERNSFHVYLDGGKIHALIHDADGLLIWHDTEDGDLTFAHCIPSKRAYPQDCDFEFCVQIKDSGCAIPFTVSDWKGAHAPFAGLRLSELNTKFRPGDFLIQFDKELQEEIQSVCAEMSWFAHSWGDSCAYQVQDQLRSAANSFLREKLLRQDKYANRDASLWLENCVEYLPDALIRDGNKLKEDVGAQKEKLLSLLIRITNAKLEDLMKDPSQARNVELANA